MVSFQIEKDSDQVLKLTSPLRINTPFTIRGFPLTKVAVTSFVFNVSSESLRYMPVRVLERRRWGRGVSFFFLPSGFLFFSFCSDVTCSLSECFGRRLQKRRIVESEGGYRSGSVSGPCELDVGDDGLWYAGNKLNPGGLRFRLLLGGLHGGRGEEDSVRGVWSGAEHWREGGGAEGERQGCQDGRQHSDFGEIPGTSPLCHSGGGGTCLGKMYVSGKLARLRVLRAMLLSVLPILSYNNGRAATPPMGWNSWCTDSLCNVFGRDPCSEEMVKSTVDAMLQNGMKKAGYNYAVLDDCWATTERDAQGNLQYDKQRFPSGMKALADYAHERGFGFGLYTSYGTVTCKGNRPGSYDHYEADAKLLASWGVDFIKMDHCGRPHGNHTGDKALYGQMSAALNATGRNILFSLCQWGDDEVWKWGSEIAQMYRISMDHLPFWSLPDKAQGTGLGQGVRDVIEWMAVLQPSRWVKQFGWMDPDFLMTMYWPTMGYIESRTEFSFWSLWSAPLMVSTDVRKLSKEKQSILLNEEIIAIDQDPSNTAGDRIWNASDGSQLWGRSLANGDKAVILYNDGRSHGAVNVSVAWSQLGWPKTSLVKVRDLWLHKDVGNYSQGFQAPMLAPRDVVYLRLARVQ